MFELNKNLCLENREIDVFAMGELLVDMISSEYDEDAGLGSYNKFFGGSPANIAMNIKKLGGNSSVYACVGKDSLGDFLINKLEEENINTKNIKRADLSTSMVLVTKSRNTPIPIFYRGADYSMDYSDKLEALLLQSKIVHFSCWPISQNYSRNTIEKVLEFSRKNNLIIGFDPNYHEMIWEKEHDGIEYIKKIISKVDIIKPSEVDAERIFGADTPENQIKKFLDLGAKLVIMTLGKDGAIVSNGKKTLTFETFAEEIVDTTGAGDAFWSGFYMGLVTGHTIIDSLKLGFGTSAFKLKYVGAMAPLPDIKEIEKIYIKKEVM